MKLNNAFTPEQQETAMAQGQEEAAKTELPEERYAALGSWAARKIIKSTKAATTEMSGAVGINRKDIYEKYNITPKQVEETKQPIEKIELKASEDRPLDGKEVTPEYSFSVDKEAAQLDRSDLADFDTTDTFQMNFDTLETADDVSAVIGAMAERNKTAINEARRGVIQDEQLRGLADDLGQDPQFIKDVLNRKEGEAFSAEKILATRQVLEQSATKLKTLATKVANNEATETDRFQFQRQLAFHQEFQMQFMGARAEIGRSLRAMGVPTGGDQANIEKTMEMVTAAERGIDVDMVAKSITLADDVKGINRTVDAVHRSKANVAFDSVYEIYINSILSGFKTHIVNLMGSKLRLWTDIVDTAVAARMGGGDANPGDKIHADEWKAAFFAQQIVSQESLEIAMRTMKTGDAYKGLSKIETIDRRTIDSFVFAQTFGLNPDGKFAGVVDFVGNTLRAPTERLMGGTDALMRHQAERVHIVKAAFREAAYLSDLNGLNKEDTMSLLQDLIENPTEKVLREATDFGSDVTFQTPLGKQGQKFQQVVQNIPGLRYVFPFVKTPANLLKQGFLERTPMGFLTKKYQEDVAAGGARAQIARSKIATGSVLATSMYFMASHGKITGSNPQDGDVRKARYEAGWRPRSFVIENTMGEKTYISYDRMEPLSYIVGSVADFHEMMEASQYDVLGEEESDKQGRMAASIVMAISENTLNKSFMTGARDIMNVLTKPTMSNAKGYIARLTNAFIPFSGSRRDITRLNDPVKRTTESVATYIQSNMPGASDELPPRIDNFGEEVKFDTVLNPWPMVVEDSSWEQTEINQLATETRRSPIPTASRTVGGVKMSDEEYYEFKLLARKDLVVDGYNFRDTIRNRISDPDFELLADDERVDVLTDITMAFDRQARGERVQQDMTLMEKLQRKSFVKAARRQAQENGTDPEEELENIKDLYLQGE